MSGSVIKPVSMGGRVYLDQEAFLDFLDNRARLVLDKLKVHGTPLSDTEFLRGQSFEQENIRHAISPPTPTAR
jgi:hypothetical protein